ncbi:MAG: ABC transporter substrate-binding protein, partial [Rhodobacteraceae bacterium]|nr:ABC transporter substrate-binding protein [Paracoccaceae bacterium]
DAPKGGTLRLSAPSTYDSFNPFIPKGIPAAGLTYLGDAGYFIEGLTMAGIDEPFTQYCLLCETVEVAEDRSWIEFSLRPEARFHDGNPVTPEDVIFSFDMLMEKGQPLYQLYWGDVDRVEKTGDRKVRFIFKTTENSELPMIIGQLPVLSRAYWEKRDFAQATLDVPVSTGPYKIDRYEQGRYIVYKRDPNYWGRDLTIKAGVDNFDEIRFDYFRDNDVSFQAFLADNFDIFVENTATRWATGYDERLIADKKIIKQGFRDGLPDNVQCFVLNLRRGKFADALTRQALALAFDFDWSNKTLAFGQYEPMASYFQGSELAATGLPDAAELAVLEKYRNRIPPEVFTTAYQPPRTDGSGNNRENLLKARTLLQQAGWVAKDGALTDPKTGTVFEIEFLTAQQGIEKWFSPYIRNLERLGIKASIRLVDTSQYVNRLGEYDFDVVLGGPAQSVSPGNEQREYWGSEAADRPRSRNWSGIKNPVIDEIIEDLIRAPTRDDLVAHTRALDRVLLWNHYAVPELSVPVTRYAYWNRFGYPAVTPLRGVDLSTWWFDQARASAVGTPSSK